LRAAGGGLASLLFWLRVNLVTGYFGYGLFWLWVVLVMGYLSYGLV
jgi:hypothetical protein